MVFGKTVFALKVGVPALMRNVRIRSSQGADNRNELPHSRQRWNGAGAGTRRPENVKEVGVFSVQDRWEDNQVANGYTMKPRNSVGRVWFVVAMRSIM